MTITLAFDLFGTLINAHGLLGKLQGIIGDRAAAQEWPGAQRVSSQRSGVGTKKIRR
jgi:hypothetical protein